MKAMVEVAELRKAAQVAAMFTGFRDTGKTKRGKKEPWEKGPIKIQSSASGLSVVAIEKDGLSGVVITIPHPVSAGHEPGECLIAPVKLIQILASMPKKATALVTGHNGTVGISAAGSFLVPSYSGEAPAFAAAKPFSTRLKMTAGELLALLNQVAYALPTRDHRRILMGINLTVKAGTIRATATDGKKMVIIPHATANMEANAECTVMIPGLRKALRYFRPAEEITLAFSPDVLTITGTGVVVSVSNVQGKYPDCDSVLPKTFSQEFTIGTDAMLEALHGAAVVATKPYRIATLKFGEGKCYIASGDPEGGKFAATIPAGSSGEPFRVDFDVEFLLATLAQITAKTFLFRYQRPNAPVLFGDENAPGKIMLVMPVKGVE